MGAEISFIVNVIMKRRRHVLKGGVCRSPRNGKHPAIRSRYSSIHKEAWNGVQFIQKPIAHPAVQHSPVPHDLWD